MIKCKMSSVCSHPLVSQIAEVSLFEILKMIL